MVVVGGGSVGGGDVGGSEGLLQGSHPVVIVVAGIVGTIVVVVVEVLML